MTLSPFSLVHRAICREQRAVYGEPPCFEVAPEEWPNAECNEPGCYWLARAACAAVGIETPDAGDPSPVAALRRDMMPDAKPPPG